MALHDVPPAVKEDATFNEIEKIALQTESEMKQMIEQAAEDPTGYQAFELRNVMKTYPVKPVYRDKAAALRIPRFFEEVDAGLFNNPEENRKLVTRSTFLEGFKLSKAEADLAVGGAAEAYKIDLKSFEAGEVTPEFYRLSKQEVDEFVKYINTLSPEDQKRELLGRIKPLLNRLDMISDREIHEYILRIFSGLTSEQMESVKQNPVIFASKLKDHIQRLMNRYAVIQFEKDCAANRIKTIENWRFPTAIGPLETRTGLPKSLYAEEDKPNNFELKVINEVANLDNVLFWHRNIERKGFCLNGWINHYPDFIIVTERDTVILLETKGDDRDNSDSEEKLKLGKAWESMAGRQYKYFMVFDQNPIAGAFRFDEFLGVIGNL